MQPKYFNIFFYSAIAALTIICVVCINLPLLDLDSSQYAYISKEMFRTGNYLQVHLNGRDYLDKPPLVFWMSCLSFKVFGIHDWSFRLPSVLCLALGIYSTYRYARLFYGELAGKIAALIMASCMAAFLMCFDVRIDTMLTGWVMFSMWQLAEYNINLKLKNLALGAAGIGLVMITKGPIGLVIPVTAFSIQFIYTRQWKSFLRWQYLIGVLIIAIILLPMSYGLYEQFDMHPEKIFEGRRGVSGLRFYYWTQSFGRITGESAWSNNPDTFFLLHSFLWTFLPWTALFIVALISEIRSKIKEYAGALKTEAITVGGFVLILLFLMRSRYQLPHYTFAIHPLAAVITAKYLIPFLSDQGASKGKVISAVSVFNITYRIHFALMVVLYAAIYLLINYIFPSNIFFNIPITVSLTLFAYIFFNKKISYGYKAFSGTVLTYITVGFILAFVFYPRVLRYESGAEAVKEMNKLADLQSHLLIYKDYPSNTMAFYSKIPVSEDIDDNSISSNLIKGHTFIFADSANAQSVLNLHPDIKVVRRYRNFTVSLLTARFLNPATRISATNEYVLMKY